MPQKQTGAQIQRALARRFLKEEIAKLTKIVAEQQKNGATQPFTPSSRFCLFPNRPSA
jgi:hypothetical protein